MKKGFTLLELIVVIIIIGILSTLGLSQYMKVVEKGRTAESKQNLGLLRSMMHIYYQENGKYYTDPTTFSLPNTGATCTNTKFYYGYSVTSGTTETTSYITAARCTAGGKTPNVSSGYSISMDMEGTLKGGPM